MAPAIDLDQFYADLLHEIGRLAQRGGTAIGAGAVVKRVAQSYGIAAAECLPLPRLTRSELDQFERIGSSRRMRR